MFTLVRKQGEGVVINDDIFLTVVEIRGDKVRLGIECPLEVPVHSGKVYQAIHQEAEEAETLE
jgi:carbon storage regulator